MEDDWSKMKLNELATEVRNIELVNIQSYIVTESWTEGSGLLKTNFVQQLEGINTLSLSLSLTHTQTN